MDPVTPPNTPPAQPPVAPVGTPPVQPSPPPASTPNITPPSGGPKFGRPLVVGLVVVLLLAVLGGAGWYLTQQKSLTPPSPVVAEPSMVPPVANALTLQLTSPKEGELVSSQLLNVTGKTAPEVTVAIYTDTEETSVISSPTGDFTGTIRLQTGINMLTVTAFDEDGQEVSVNMEIVYDQEN
jgi:hypothetical protein